MSDKARRALILLMVAPLPSPFEIGIGALMHCGCYGMWYLRGT
jgi:hypothetical protein